MRAIDIKGMTIGPGVPKVIVSLMGAEEHDLLDQARRGLALGVDCFEYRADFAADPHDAAGMAAVSRSLREALPHNPLLFAFRTAGQGGKVALSADELEAVCRTAIDAGAADALDIESWLGDSAVSALCAEAHEAGMAAIVSFHDFQGTPPEDELVRLLQHFGELGADISKVAVYANSPADVVAVLGATERASRLPEAGPLITIAMGAQGSLTRLAGEVFGSALTFCALDAGSAPGQVGVAQAKGIMEQLHEISVRGSDAQR